MNKQTELVLNQINALVPNKLVDFVGYFLKCA